MTVLAEVPPLMPKVSVAPLELLARKVPLVAVKTSKTVVSISVGPVIAFSVGGVGGEGGDHLRDIEVQSESQMQSRLAQTKIASSSALLALEEPILEKSNRASSKANGICTLDSASICSYMA